MPWGVQPQALGCEDAAANQQPVAVVQDLDAGPIVGTCHGPMIGGPH
jgi:hypothetical protein